MNSFILPKPQCGDVIFTSTNSRFNRIASFWAQRKIDAMAHESSRYFTHVAVAINDTIALEAVPAPIASASLLATTASKIAPKMHAEDAPTKSHWSKVDLDFGVRLIPIGDILVGAMEKKSPLLVLRSGLDTTESAKRLDILSPYILATIGCAYSIDELQQSMENNLNPLQKLISSNLPNLMSSASDLYTMMNLTPEHLAFLDEWAPDALPEYQLRSYYCSQLVQKILDHAMLTSESDIPTKITPSGLYKALTDLGWRDVTETDYSRGCIQHLNNNNSARSNAARKFHNFKHQYQAAVNHKAIELTVTTISKSMDKSKHSLGNTQFQLDKLININTDNTLEPEIKTDNSIDIKHSPSSDIKNSPP
ncbi:hypothetical protein [Pseudomonas izuensis]|uniref:hypothetical protein n=1 Tax=Pseudomonas izuensis TaxID=2684212 RepID=UPI001356C4A0|nr:hypothetical protein [Pseudomonas izuensis]